MRWNLAVAALATSFGIVSIIVRKVDLDAATLVFYRCLFAVPAIGLTVLLTRRLFVLGNRWTWKAAFLLGITLGTHWFLFFETIKLSTVAFAVLTAYLAPIMVAAVAPLVLPERRSRVAVLALVPASVGLVLVALTDEIELRAAAMATGLGTALTYAALVIGTKYVSSRVSAAGLTFGNYALAGLVMIPLVVTGDRVLPSGGDWAYVVLLGVIFTAVSGYLYVGLIRKVTAQAMGVLAYLEPVSAALLAWAFVGESLTPQIAVGGALIIGSGLAVVLLEPPDPAGAGLPVTE